MATSILDWVAEFQQQKIKRSEFEQAMESQIQRFQRQQDELGKVKVLAHDQTRWEQELKPGLEACYEGLIGAASEALEYAKTRNDELVPGIVGLVQEVNKIMAYLELKAELVSPQTRQLLEQNIAQQSDGLSIQAAASQGTADSQLAFLDTGD